MFVQIYFDIFKKVVQKHVLLKKRHSYNMRALKRYIQTSELASGGVVDIQYNQYKNNKIK